VSLISEQWQELKRASQQLFGLMQINYLEPFIYIPLFEETHDSVFAFVIFKQNRMIINIKNLAFEKITLRFNWNEIKTVFYKEFPEINSIFLSNEKSLVHIEDFIASLTEIVLD